MLFALHPVWNDFFTVAGFFVGVIGFAVTIWQLRRTRSAAQAAKQAALQTLNETRVAYDRFIAGIAYKYFAELRMYADSKQWHLALLRCDDLADLLSQQKVQDLAVAATMRQLREFSRVFVDMRDLTRMKFSRKKWDIAVTSIHTLVDGIRGILGERRIENDPESKVGIAGSEAAGQNT
jgi:hypothetical protein